MPTDKTRANAQSFVSQNTAGLSGKCVHAYVTEIEVSGEENMVTVNVSANLSILFPWVALDIMVTETGIAKYRAITH